MPSDNESDPNLVNPTTDDLNPSAATPNLTPATLVLHKIIHISAVQKPIQTELKQSPPNYRQWRILFSVALGKYNLLSHIDGSVQVKDEFWPTLDFTVQSWIYATIHDDILQTVLREGSSARDIWLAIEDLFRDNRPARAIQLESEFRGLKQGTLSINDYFLRLNILADRLADVDSPVSDSNLVLQMLGGLNETYVTMASVLTNQKSFPTFQSARSSLMLDETRRHNSNSVATALIAQTTSPPTVDSRHSFTPTTEFGRSYNPSADSGRSFNSTSKGKTATQPNGANLLPGPIRLNPTDLVFWAHLLRRKALPRHSSIKLDSKHLNGINPASSTRLMPCPFPQILTRNGIWILDIITKEVISCCTSRGELYLFLPNKAEPDALITNICPPPSLWHLRLGHP